MSTYKLLINGKSRTVTVDADTPLLWVLRDHLGLLGTKYSCGMGVCGSCTVLLDGKPVRSCITPIRKVGERRILTIEGLAQDKLHAVQAAWLEEDVPQCGYCQPGQILAAVALLEEIPKPSDEDINRAMSPILCRCGTYQRIRRAIHRAAGEV